MTIQEASKKSIRLTAIDANGEIKVFLIMVNKYLLQFVCVYTCIFCSSQANKEEIQQLYSQLDIRVKQEIDRQKSKNPDDQIATEELTPIVSCSKKQNLDTGEN